MDLGRLLAALEALAPEDELGFSFGELPFDELLLTLHRRRFTGVVELGTPPEVDRLFLREGAMVGLLARPSVELQQLGNVIVQLKILSREMLGATLDEDPSAGGVELAQRLVESALVAREDMDRALEEHGRRRLFSLYDLGPEPVLVREGFDRLAHFHPIAVDVRPAIAFGMVARSSPQRRREALRRLASRRVRMQTPYDERRNTYGFPPPILAALRDLARGVTFGLEPSLPGLAEGAGLLLFLERMSLLQLE